PVNNDLFMQLSSSGSESQRRGFSVDRLSPIQLPLIGDRKLDISATSGVSAITALAAAQSSRGSQIQRRILVGRIQKHGALERYDGVELAVRRQVRHAEVVPASRLVRRLCDSVGPERNGVAPQ